MGKDDTGTGGGWGEGRGNREDGGGEAGLEDGFAEARNPVRYADTRADCCTEVKNMILVEFISVTFLKTKLQRF